MDAIEWMGHITTVSSITVSLVGVHVCFRFVQRGNTGDMSAMPFIANFVNSCTWLRYGILVSILPVIIVNAVATFLNFTYISFFYVYTLKKLQFTRTLFVAVIVLLSPLYYIKYYDNNVGMAAAHLGTLGTLTTVMSYAAPLASLRDVLRTKSTDSMSFPMVLANFVIAVEWVLYGYLLHDKYIQMPNAIGMLLGLLQLGLFARFPGKPSSQSMKV